MALDEGQKLRKKFDDNEFKMDQIRVQFQVIELKKKSLSNEFKKLIRNNNSIQAIFDRIEKHKEKEALETLENMKKNDNIKNNK